MADDGAKRDTGTLQRHLLDAEMAIVELNRQIAERARFSIPTIGLEEELRETIASRNALRARLEQSGEEHHGRRQDEDREAGPRPD